jgi:hypothetical protein
MRRPIGRSSRVGACAAIFLLLLPLGVAAHPSSARAASTSRPSPPGWPARLPAARVLSSMIGTRVATVSAARRLGEAMALASVEGSEPSRRPRYLIVTLAPLSDPYHVLQFDAASGPGGGSFEGVTFQYDRPSNSNQTYVWTHRAPASAVWAAPGTRRAHLVLDTNLATADMSFTPTRLARHRTFGCNTFLAPEASKVTWSRGRLNGTFDYTPREANLQSHATTLPAIVEKIVPTGQHCPGPPLRCYSQWTFEIWNGNTFVEAFKFRPHMKPWVDAIHWVGGKVNWEWQEVFGFPLYTDPVARTWNTISFDASHAGPFLSGAITFQRNGRLFVRHRFGCTVHIHGFSWRSGDVTMNLDPGPVTIGGATSHARTYLFRQP